MNRKTFLNPPGVPKADTHNVRPPVAGTRTGKNREKKTSFNHFRAAQIRFLTQCTRQWCFWCALAVFHKVVWSVDQCHVVIDLHVVDDRFQANYRERLAGLDGQLGAKTHVLRLLGRQAKVVNGVTPHATVGARLQQIVQGAAEIFHVVDTDARRVDASVVGQFFLHNVLHDGRGRGGVSCASRSDGARCCWQPFST